jgi:hypothetical protein
MPTQARSVPNKIGCVPVYTSPFTRPRLHVAQALAEHGPAAVREQAVKTLASLAAPAQNGVLVSMSALAAIEALGEKAASIHQAIAAMKPSGPSPDGRYNSYVPRLIQNIVPEPPAANRP